MRQVWLFCRMHQHLKINTRLATHWNILVVLKNMSIIVTTFTHRLS